MVIKGPQEYMAYLLRLWPVQGQGKTIWRASLEDAQSSECRNFTNLADLFTYLQARTDALSNSKAEGDEKWP